MPNYRLRFGSYDLPTTLRPAGQDLPYTDGATARLREPGSVTRTPRLQEITLAVQGEFVGDTLNDFLAQRDAIIGNCQGKADLWYGRDDRYYKNAQLDRASLGVPDDGVLYGVNATVTFNFVSREYPEAFSVNTASVTLTASGGTVPGQGDLGSKARPTWTITVGTGGTGSLVLTNTTTGEVCIIAKPTGNFASGDVITLDRDTATAKLNGVIVLGLYDRRIPSIQGGINNIITLASSGTASPSALSLVYPPRYR